MNALAQHRYRAGTDRSRAIAGAAIRTAREQLILRRKPNLEQLTDKLEEERVRRMIGAVLNGGQASTDMRPRPAMRVSGPLYCHA